MGALRRLRAMSGLMRASCLVLAVCAVWFAVNLASPVGPPVLLWLPTPVGALLLTAAFRSTSKAVSLPAPTRRFWGHLSLSALLVGVAHTAQAIDVLTHPDVGGAYNGPGLLIFDSGAILMIVYALYRLPLSSRSAGERLRVTLDGGTVVAGAAVFIWHFQTRIALGTDDRSQVVGSLILGVLALVVVLAVAKVTLSSYEFIDKSALQWLAFAIFFGATSSLLQPLLAGHPDLMVTQISIPVVCCLASWAAERQRLAAGRAVAVRRRRRPFSLVPYAAVGAVYVLLILETWSRGHTDQKMLVLGAVTLTALVMVRQVAAFVDNGRLLARLDHGATHDALTHLPNRTLFGQRLQQALDSPERRPVGSRSSTSTTSRRSTTPSATRSATCCWSRWRGASPAARAPRDTWPASAATSSSWSCPAPARPPPASSRTASPPRCAPTPSSTATSCRSRPASASPTAAPATTRACCCATPTSPCTRRRSSPAPRSCTTTARCRSPAATTRSCGPPSPTGGASWCTSRSSPSTTAAWSVPRRSCAGTTPSTASCPRTRSSPSPNAPA